MIEQAIRIRRLGNANTTTRRLVTAYALLSVRVSVSVADTALCYIARPLADGETDPAVYSKALEKINLGLRDIKSRGLARIAGLQDFSIESLVQVPGLGLAKAHFAQALLGNWGTLCLDVNVLRFTFPGATTEQIRRLQNRITRAPMLYERVKGIFLRRFRKRFPEINLAPFLAQWYAFDIVRKKNERHQTLIDVLELYQ